VSIPSTITAGDTVAWAEDLACFPAGAVLSYALRGPATPVDVTVQADGSASIAPDKTAAMNPNTAAVRWSWALYSTVGDARKTVGSGLLLVMPNLATQTGTFDGRSQTEKDLDAVRDAISKRAAGGMVLSYTIGSRQLSKEPMTALLALQSSLEQRLRAERATAAKAAGLGNPAKLLSRFGRRRRLIGGCDAS
jgi:hypothetical protein